MAKQIIRWNPVRDMVAMQSAMDRLFDDVTQSLGEGNAFTSNLPLDIHETDDNYVVVADVPGLMPDDINITLHENRLTIAGEFKQEETREDTRALVTERYYGNFSRSLTLPTNIEADDVEAAYDNGVLRLTLPKAENARPRQIRINTTGLLQNQN